jgi:hypothetical protein
MIAAARAVAGRVHLILVAAACASALATWQLASAFMQLPDEPSPASGTAQVVAQGVVQIGSGDLRWEVTERTAQLPANASLLRSSLGFLTVDSGVMLVEDRTTGAQERLPAGEAMLTQAGSEQVRFALGSDTAAYHEIGLVDAAAEPPAEATVVYQSEPIAGTGERHDLDLVQDALAPGAATTLPAGSLPTLVLILAGAADVTTESGDVISLGAGEAAALAGALTATAGENGATIAAAYTGPVVPATTPGAATPSARGVVAVTATERAQPAASPTARAVATRGAAAEESDDDGDGLTNAREAEVGTDPALADTDEDGLTDGEEVLTYGTDPLRSDTDGDGVLDGDEVAQGTDPLNGVSEATTVESAPPAEEPATSTEETAPEGATATDSDGDGLEDAIEYELGTDPFDPDTDKDGLTDGQEYYTYLTGTRNPDTDGDGVLDGDEVANGTDPNDPNSN